MSQAATGFLARLKQRKLVQWALAYLAAAWVSSQVLGLAADSYTVLSAQEMAASAKALRRNPNIVPLPSLRIADLETRLPDLTSNNREMMQHLHAIAQEKS